MSFVINLVLNCSQVILSLQNVLSSNDLFEFSIVLLLASLFTTDASRTYNLYLLVILYSSIH